jgi:CBS domain-containing protein
MHSFAAVGPRAEGHKTAPGEVSVELRWLASHESGPNGPGTARRGSVYWKQQLRTLAKHRPRGGIMQTIQRLHRSGVGVGPDRTIAHVAQVMEQSGIGFIAVVEDGLAIGVVTDRDIVRRAVAAGLETDARVDSIMSTPVLTLEAEADLAEAYSAFRRHAVRRLVVVDGTHFVGVVSLDDLLVDVATNLANLTAPLTAEIDAPHRDPGSLIESGQ